MAGRVTGRPALRLRIEGQVQAVGYRRWAVETAARLGLAGWVRNLDDGAVEVLAVGYPAALEAMAEACARGPAAAAVSRLERYTAQDDGSIGFAERP